jgi:hypothetical protein
MKYPVDHPRVFFITKAHEKNRKGRYSRKAGYFWWRKMNVSENLSR